MRPELDICSWNLRGTLFCDSTHERHPEKLRKSLKKRQIVSELVREHGITCLQETGAKSSFIDHIRQEWGHSGNLVHLNAADAGNTRSSLIITRGSFLERYGLSANEVSHHRFDSDGSRGYSHCLHYKNNNIDLIVVNVYFPQNVHGKIDQINQIKQLVQQRSPTHCVLIGDFNFVENRNHRYRIVQENGVRIIEQAGAENGLLLAAFDSLREALRLTLIEQDLPTHSSFSNGVPCRSIIDRAYFNWGLADRATQSIHIGLPKYEQWVSDHRPISLKIVNRRQSGSKRRILPWVTRVPEFCDLAVKYFQNHPDRHAANPWTRHEVLVEAFFHAQKYIVRNRKKYVCSHVEDRIAVASALYQHISSDVQDFEKVNMWLEINPELIELVVFDLDSNRWEADVAAFDEFLEKRISETAQTSPDQPPLGASFSPQGQGLVETLAQKRFSRKRVEWLFDSQNGTHTNDTDRMKEILEEHYAHVWGPPENENQDTIDQYCNNIEKRFDDNVSWDITLEDVRDAIINSNHNSSPGPDGVTFSCYKSTNCISAEIIFDILQSIRNSTFEPPQDAYQCLLYLIPKAADFEILIGDHLVSSYSPKKTRPITVGNSIARLLAGAIKIVYSKAVDSFCHPDQTAYIEGRDICHNVSVVNDWIHSGKQNNLARWCLFVDFSNAFSSISHAFIKSYLEKINVPIEFRRLITFPLTTYHTLILNGRSFPFPSCQAGCRQGCPISAITFILLLENLLHKIRSLQLGRNGWNPRVLAYADDVVILLERPRKSNANDGDFRKITALFCEFRRASNLTVNFSKTCIVPASGRWTQHFKSLFHGSTWGNQNLNFKLSETYLGLQVGADVTPEMAYSKAVEKFESAWLLWRAIPLTFQAKFIVINTFLLPIVGYIGQFLLLSKKHNNYINSLCFRFFTNFNWIARRDVCLLGHVLGISGSGFPRDPGFWNISAILRRIRHEEGVPNATTPHSIKTAEYQAIQQFREITGVEFSDRRTQYAQTKAACQTVIYNDLCNASVESTKSNYFTRVQRLFPNITQDQFSTFLSRFKHTLSKSPRSGITFSMLFDIIRLHFNGVVTKRRGRFWLANPNGHCIFCNAHEDSIEHWLECSVIRDASAACGLEWDTSRSLLFQQDDEDAIRKCYILFWAAVVRAHYRLSHSHNTSIELQYDYYRRLRKITPRSKNENEANLPEHLFTIFFAGSFCQICGVSEDGISAISPFGEPRTIPRVFFDSPERVVHVFLDGSAQVDQNGVERAGWAFILVGLRQIPVQFCAPMLGSNNAAEVSSVHNAACFIFDNLNEFPLNAEFVFVVDSTYAAGVASGAWKHPEASMALRDVTDAAWNSYRALRSRVRIKFEHCWSHTGIILNDLVDYLAGEARRGLVRHRYTSCDGAELGRAQTWQQLMDHQF